MLAKNKGKVPFFHCPFLILTRDAVMLEIPVTINKNSYMFAKIEFNPSAFKHDVSEVDIRRAIERFIYEDPLEDFDNKYLLLGFDTKGTLLEVIYNLIDEDTINVFHAMPCRKNFYDLLRRK